MLRFMLVVFAVVGAFASVAGLFGALSIPPEIFHLPTPMILFIAFTACLLAMLRRTSVQ
jgi:hypothetical protein